ncbi:putative sugar O-methyltransferase [Elioraea rosea]|uniref:putative sugar O-methyltransferase n=1 Tax=Elioraea rosea TaxID=2492390 RepID=UPI00118564AB|nr:putative sugar O-methyltransferase [Elioraea rosea]
MDALRRRLGKTRAKLARWRYAPRITHPAFTRPLIGRDPPAVERLPPGAEPDDALLARIAACFAAARGQATSTTPSMWDEHERLRAPFLEALEAADLPRLRAQFGDLFGGVLLDGMSHGNALFGDEARNPYGAGFLGLRTVDCLLALAEATGEAAVPCYAQMTLPRYIETMQGDLGALLARLEARLGFPLAMPAVGRPYVVRLGGTATAPDILRHAYLAHRLRELGLGEGARVLEIGGGFGMFAYCARRAGLGPVTIIDLPFVGAIQMGWLGAALSPADVAGIGETPAAVTLLPPDAVAALPDDGFDVVVNVDSLPEMGHATALAYLREIRRLAPRFVSINQETQKVHAGAAQNRVAALAEEAGGYHRASRFRHWMEQGYVEELYLRS